MHRPGMTKLAIGLFVLIVFIAFTPANQAQAFLNNAADSHIYINEFQYGYTAAQTGDFVEIMGPARMTLNGWTLNSYSAQGALLESKPLSGTFPNQTYKMVDSDRGMTVDTGGFGTLVFDYADLPANGALALIRPDSGLSMFISWNGAVTATINGTAATSTNVFTGTKDIYRSIGLFGEGDSYADFSWNKYAPVMQSRGITNNYQKMGSEVFFNELTYQDEDGDNTADKYERIEIAAPNGVSLSNWSVVLYNGATGTVYKTIPFTEFEEGPQGQVTEGIRIWEKTWSSSMRNNIINTMGGLALVDGNGYVWQFISYLGSFTATNGPAAGITSTDIGVRLEWNYIWWFRSLQVGGDGRVSTDFAWYPPANYTPLRINQGQDFHPAGTVDTPPFVEVVTPPDKSINFPLDGNLIVDFNASVNTDPGWVTLVCERGGTSTLSISGQSSAYAYTLDPTVNLLPADRCTVTVKAANVYDSDALSYDYLTRDFVWSFTTYNQPPVANNQTIPALEDTPVSITLSATDPEGLPLSAYQLKVAP